MLKDLDHYKRNNVYRSLVNKGGRRSNTLRNYVGTSAPCPLTCRRSPSYPLAQSGGIVEARPLRPRVDPALHVGSSALIKFLGSNKECYSLNPSWRRVPKGNGEASVSKPLKFQNSQYISSRTSTRLSLKMDRSRGAWSGSDATLEYPPLPGGSSRSSRPKYPKAVDLVDRSRVTNKCWRTGSEWTRTVCPNPMTSPVNGCELFYPLGCGNWLDLNPVASLSYGTPPLGRNIRLLHSRRNGVAALPFALILGDH